MSKSPLGERFIEGGLPPPGVSVAGRVDCESLIERKGEPRVTSSESWHRHSAGISTASIIVFGVAGVALRLRQYLFNRSLWIDEAALALNIGDRDLVSLLAVPLIHHQSASPGFLLLSHAFVAAFGFHEWALRLTPLLAGLLIIPVALLLARNEFKSATAKTTFIGFVSFSPILIFYSSEFKQYSSDALVALSLVLAVSYRNSRYGTWLLAVIGFVGLACSLPAVFVAAPAAILILCEALRASRWRQVISVGLAWSAGAAIHAAYYLSAGVDRGYMVSAWGKVGTFAPFPPSSSAEFLWYPRSLASLAYLIFRQLDQAGPRSLDPLDGFLVLVLAFGLIAIILSRRSTAIVAAGAIVTTLLAAALKIYPFSGRLLIFLVPLALLIIAAGIDELHLAGGRVVATLVGALLLAVVIPSAAEFALRPRFNSDMRGALEVVERGFADGDAVAVWPNQILFDFYGSRLKTQGNPVFVIGRRSPASSVIEVAKKEGYRRVWIVAAHRVGEAKTIVKETARQVPILFEWSTHGTRVWLLDFANTNDNMPQLQH